MMRKGTGKNTNAWKIVSSCLKTVSNSAGNVVRSAVAVVSSLGNDRKDQVTWAGFGKLKFHASSIKHVLLVGYANGFQVIDVEDSYNFNELLSKRDFPVIFIEILPAPVESNVKEQISSLHPIILVVEGKDDRCQRSGQNHSVNQLENCVSPTGTIQFYSFISRCYIRVLSFPSPVLMVRSSPRIVAVGLKSQICCIDACSLEKKFSVSTYPVPQFERQGQVINTGYGPMAVGPRWLAYAPETPYISSAGHPKNLVFPGISPSKFPGNSSLMAHFAMQCGKQVATAMMNFGDRGCKTLSKYYPGFLSDVDISSVWNGGKLTTQEMENAGMVVIKDVLSTAIITQFRAHSSPISALCFDPSGTLLVTASIHGNNINIFRIRPLARCNGSTLYDWKSSHIHLYKLYRGITSAMIRDICFSHCCRWVCIVTSKGTCHIFLLPPLVGEATVQTSHSHLKGTSFSWPWWSTSSFTLKEQQSFPPPPSTFTVATRIKDTSSNLFHMKNVAAAVASATGMKLAPSGSLAATFHASIADGLHDLHLATGSLEHLLLFTPTGFVVQYKLLPSAATKVSDVSPKPQPGLHVNTQDDPDEVFRVNAEPVQWWDVCRRSDHSERDDYSLGTSLNEVEDSAQVDSRRVVFLKESAGSNKSVKSDWYISNAEVHMHSTRDRIWQRSKICFHVITPPKLRWSSCGELEIEKFLSHEVEIKKNASLPVFDHFLSMKSPWVDNVYSRKCNRPAVPRASYREVGLEHDTDASSLVDHQLRNRVNEGTVICRSKSASFRSNESSDRGSSSPVENLLDLDLLSVDNSPVASRHTLNDLSDEETGNLNSKTYNSTFSGFHPGFRKVTSSTKITDDDDDDDADDDDDDDADGGDGDGDDGDDDDVPSKEEENSEDDEGLGGLFEF